MWIGDLQTEHAVPRNRHLDSATQLEQELPAEKRRSPWNTVTRVNADVEILLSSIEEIVNAGGVQKPGMSSPGRLSATGTPSSFQTSRNVSPWSP
jgi:hypothetical protein